MKFEVSIWYVVPSLEEALSIAELLRLRDWEVEQIALREVEPKGYNIDADKIIEEKDLIMAIRRAMTEIPYLQYVEWFRIQKARENENE